MEVATEVAAKNRKASKATAKQSKGKAPAKQPKGKASKLPTSYADIIKIVDQPLADRKALAIGRKDTKIVPRRFHIDDTKLAALIAERKENPKAIPNPHNHGAYWLFVEALKSLGINKAHAFKIVKAEMKTIGSREELNDAEGVSLWSRFANKEGRMDNDENNYSLDEKIHQNAEVLQRLGGFTPYGLKLLQVGQKILKTSGLVVDILKGKDSKAEYKLNTDSAKPINQFRRQPKESK